MESFQNLVDGLNTALKPFVDGLSELVWEKGIPVGTEEIPFVVIALLGVGFFLTLRFGFIQMRRLGHGAAVTSGRYDDPDEPGDVSHFQALTTALSATIGIGNIAGVALAIHWGGPGAVFWMWMTAVLGMAIKYAEVVLAQHYRQIIAPDKDPRRWEGSVAGGPMYYIERGLGPKWKPMAVFFAIMLALTAFLTGNAVQANTVADTMLASFSLPTWITGLFTAFVVGLVIVGGIARIGRVTGILAPIMATIYVLGALTIIALNLSEVLPSFGLIFREAFNPTAGVAGTGVGAVLTTMMWGVKRGLYSNEAGQGSAPIAHAAAKTDEPVSEGAVALLEPFIDTIIICTMTALVIIITGVWSERNPTRLSFTGGHSSYVMFDEDGHRETTSAPAEIRVQDGRLVEDGPNVALFAWHDVPVEEFYLDAEMTQPFTGVIFARDGRVESANGTTPATLYGPAVENAAPLTMLGFRRGLEPLGDWGHYIVILSVLLFGVSTAISFSYYGDRSTFYLLGAKAVMPYKVLFVIMHFLGAVIPLSTIWDLGDAFLGIVILPNLLALILLSPVVLRLTKSYFERKPWLEAEKKRKERLAAARADR